MMRLSLALLGAFQITLDGEPVTGFESDKVRALLAYLALEANRPHRRDRLAEMLWPDRPQGVARNNLKQALANLRKVIGDREADPPFLIVSRARLQFNPDSAHWVDVKECDALLAACQAHNHRRAETCKPCTQRFRQVVALYQGPFLEQFYLGDSAAFEEWALFRREEWQRRVMEVFRHLTAYHERRGEYKEARQFARRQVELEPWDEAAQRELMRTLALSGQRSAALKQYQACRRILADELGVEPTAETTALYERIRDLESGREGEISRFFPPLSQRHNLPLPSTFFIGREAELREIEEQLTAPGSRLLTLVGPGGIGKTRLALQVARENVGTYDHGVFFVSLTALKSADAIVPTVAQALGFSFYGKGEGQKQSSAKQQLLDYLRGKTMLLLMDNFEHLLDGVDLMTEILETALGVSILVTSRARLNVQGEQVFPVGGMDVPDEEAAEESIQSSALQLFSTSARRADPGFELTADNLTNVAHICRLVQGNPLGILLAAAWVDMLTPAEIVTPLSEIGQGLDFLETDWRDVPERQRSMRAVFDHSWSLLAEWEREVFQALSVFRGGFTDEAVRQVAGASLQELRSLVNKSMVQRGPAPSTLLRTGGRYEMHELVRQYAAEKLDQSPDGGKAVRDNHCAYYTAALQQWNADLKGSRQQTALAELDVEIENARAAWGWAVEQGQVGRLDQAVDGLCLFYTQRGRYREGEAVCYMAAEKLETITFGGGQRVQAKILTWQGVFSQRLGRTELADQLLQQSLAILEESELTTQDTRPERAFALLHLGELTSQSRREQARQAYEHSLTLYRTLGDSWGMAYALNGLGWLAWGLGDYVAARQACEESLTLRQALGDQWGVAASLQALGRIALALGQTEEGERFALKSIAILREIGDRVGVASGLSDLGMVYTVLGKFAEACPLLEESATICEDLGFRLGFINASLFLGLAEGCLGRYELTHSRAQMCIALAREIGHQWGVGYSLHLLSCGALVTKEYEKAQQLSREGATIFQEIGQQEERSFLLITLGMATRGLGQYAQAQTYLYEALRTTSEIGAFSGRLYALLVIALLLADQGQKGRAVELYALTQRYPAVHSRWHEDVFGQRIAAVAATLPPDAVEAAQERGRARDLEATVAELLEELRG